MKTKAYKQASLLRPPAPGPAPWLVFPSGEDRENHTLFNVSDPEKKNYNFLEFKGKKCLASMNGWLVMINLELQTQYRKNARFVCKTWAASVPPHRWPINQIASTTECPWLMFSNRKKIQCSFLDPISSFIHSVHMPELLGAKMCFSKAGWLLMSRGNRSIFFFNPFNNVIIELPDLPLSFRFSGLSFSSLPTSPDCIVGAFTNNYYEVDICYLRIEEKAWARRCFNNNVILNLSVNNPVFCDGAFYYLSHERHLGVLDLKDGKCDWTNLSIPEPFSSIDRNYLVECNGEMLLVSVGKLGKWVDVYKLDPSNMNWTVLNSLEDRALFVSVTTSISLMSIDVKMKNKIYFPISYKDKNNYLFYSLETRRWHSSFGDYCKEDIYDTSEQLHCTWIQPVLNWEDDFMDS
ncbi:hypothetical protein AQUCO_01500376v1 [Aquilegia coerulea]|uniref:KIB1-4 beta-propeller domain-containing protein n=1 Tax=Aquilegia coerulea TaxID=218851 RepID=A0A2G5DTH2_AQUCA|nr:hypothetical protein AQUCO_01500376v1 [Aquilegia coerulea]